MAYISDRALSPQRIKSLREERELTQGQLAYLMGVSQPSIVKYERVGCRNYWVIRRFAIALDLNVEDLVNEVEPMSPRP